MALHRGDRPTLIALDTRTTRFNPDHFGTLAELRESAEAGPCEILMVACSDHGTAPDTVSFGGADGFYVIQSMAACVPASDDTAPTSLLAGVEYAVSFMAVKHIIVCQHSGCCIIPHWLTQQVHGANQSRLSFERDVRLVVDESYPDATDWERIDLMIRRHTLVQLDNLQSHGIVQSRLRDGRLRLHGWLADDRTARVRQFDARSGLFMEM